MEIQWLPRTVSSIPSSSLHLKVIHQVIPLGQVVVTVMAVDEVLGKAMGVVHTSVRTTSSDHRDFL